MTELLIPLEIDMNYIKIPFNKLEQIVASFDDISDVDIDNPKLLPEVEKWCYDNLKFQPILPRKEHDRIKTEKKEFAFLQTDNGLYYATYLVIGIAFQSYEDALLFKMRWL